MARPYMVGPYNFRHLYYRNWTRNRKPTASCLAQWPSKRTRLPFPRSSSSRETIASFPRCAARPKIFLTETTRSRIALCAARLSSVSMASMPFSHVSGTLSRPSRSAAAAAPFPASRTVAYGCRFIPSYSGSNLSLFDVATQADSSSYVTRLRTALFGSDVGRAAACSASVAAQPVGTPGMGNIFRFKSETTRSVTKALFAGGEEAVTATGARKIPKYPADDLEAPDLHDDFYRNLLDWSPHDQIAVGLGSRVYLYKPNTKEATMLYDFGERDSPCSVRWSHEGNQLAVGTDRGALQIWDVGRLTRIRARTEDHGDSVGALAWSTSLLSSGCHDGKILHHDVRGPECVGMITRHEAEVCGLQYSCDNSMLASGGNDGRLFVWDLRRREPTLHKESPAAVKALAWSPHKRGLLACGGGTEDPCIRVWSTSTNENVTNIKTRAQVCNLVWSKLGNEIVSAHGYSMNADAKNLVNIWHVPTMAKLGTLTGHTARVLYLSISPDGRKIVTGAGGSDQTLKFWNLFPPAKSRSPHWSTSYARSYIR